jgi:hypothetical protein
MAIMAEEEPLRGAGGFVFPGSGQLSRYREWRCSGKQRPLRRWSRTV